MPNGWQTVIAETVDWDINQQMFLCTICALEHLCTSGWQIFRSTICGRLFTNGWLIYRSKNIPVHSLCTNRQPNIHAQTINKYFDWLFALRLCTNGCLIYQSKYLPHTYESILMTTQYFSKYLAESCFVCPDGYYSPSSKYSQIFIYWIPPFKGTCRLQVRKSSLEGVSVIFLIAAPHGC